MTDNDPKTKAWPAWRVTRLLKMMDYKSQGLTDKQVAAKSDMPSEKTVSRELNSPQSKQIGEDMIRRATGMIWPLLERQIRQIETDIELLPPQRITYRGKLLSLLINLLPRKIEQKIEGEMLTYDVEALLDRMIEQEELLEKNR